MGQSAIASTSLYRALLADIADTEWQAVELDFLRDRDDAEVSLRDERDVEFWTLELGTSEWELRRAIEAVGANVKALRLRLSAADEV
jgi:hypothetical protein